MDSVKKTINFIALLSCLGFVFLGFYLYFFRGVSMQPMLILGIMFFGTGAIVIIISLTSKHEGFAIDKGNLTKKQIIIISISAIVFSMCFLWLALFSNSRIILRLIFFLGFLLLGRWSIILLTNQRRKNKNCKTIL